jgi:hypothetical protein
MLFKWLKRKVPTKRDVRFFFQRLIRGWDDSETWSLDVSFAKLMLPRLKRFNEIKCGYPAHMKEKEWDSIIEEIIWGLEWFTSSGRWDLSNKAKEANFKRAKAAIQLLAKHYTDLWW